MKRKKLVLFGAILLLLNVAMANAYVVWWDDFNDNSLGSMWTMLTMVMREVMKLANT